MRPAERQHARWRRGARNLGGALLLCLSVAALPGCFSGLNSKEPPAQRYVLQAEPAGDAATAGATAAAGNAGTDASLQVLRPNPAPGLGGDAIAVLRPGARLDFYSGARWAASAPATLQRLLIDRLRSAGRFASVESDSEPFAAQYLLSLEIEHFEAVYSGDGPPTVQVTLVASLGRGSDRSVLASVSAHSAVHAEADRMQAVVSAFQQATSEALSQIAAAVTPPRP